MATLPGFTNLRNRAFCPSLTCPLRPHPQESCLYHIRYHGQSIYECNGGGELSAHGKYCRLHRTCPGKETLSLAVAQRAQPSRSTTHQVSYFCLGKCDVICNSRFASESSAIEGPHLLGRPSPDAATSLRNSSSWSTQAGRAIPGITPALTVPYPWSAVPQSRLAAPSVHYFFFFFFGQQCHTHGQHTHTHAMVSIINSASTSVFALLQPNMVSLLRPRLQPRCKLPYSKAEALSSNVQTSRA